MVRDRYSIERLEKMHHSPDRDKVLLPNRHNVELWAASYIFSSKLQMVIVALQEGFSILDVEATVRFRSETSQDGIGGKMYLDYGDGTIETLFDCQGEDMLMFYQDFERQLIRWKRETSEFLHGVIAGD